MNANALLKDIESAIETLNSKEVEAPRTLTPAQIRRGLETVGDPNGPDLPEWMSETEFRYLVRNAAMQSGISPNSG